MKLTTSQIIDGAADVLEVRGWRNDGGGWFPQCHSDDEALCVEGALKVANGGRRDQTALNAIAMHVGLPIMLSPGLSANYVWTWNDWVATAAAEVIEVLRACSLIESAREEQDAVWQSYAPNVTPAVELVDASVMRVVGEGR